MKLGLTLSGGGFRATVFHLGVLARLAEESRLEDVSVVSTVSGGSLCVGLVYALSQFTWPSSSHLIDQVIPRARELLATEDLQLGLLWRVLRSPLRIFEPRANTFSRLLRERWGITVNLNDLPNYPRWLVNSTCYETGKNWRFEHFRMGDYVFGYTYDVNIPLSDAVAASSGFPGLIGALVLDTHPCRWFRYADDPRGSNVLLNPDIQIQRMTEPVEPAFSRLHLWDGGVYDNLGLEGVVDIEEGWHDQVEFLIASDATGKSASAEYHPGAGALLRIITGVMMDQIRSLRTRSLLERMINHSEPGAYLRIGKTCQDVLSTSEHRSEIATLSAQYLSSAEATAAANTPTTISPLSSGDFERLFRHGFEVADYTLYGFHADQFKLIGYGNSHWGHQNK